MKRLLALALVLSVFGIGFTKQHRAQAVGDTTPPVGGWSWCTDTVVNGCIESVTTISPEKAETTYTSSAQLPSGLSVSATCSPNGPVNTCDSNRYYTREDGQCADRPTWGNRVIVPSVEFTIDWSGRIGWGVRIRLSTGNFRPAFTIGHGTRNVRVTADGDGTYTYINTLLMEKTYSATLPASIIALTGSPQYFSAYSEWLKTAIADSSSDRVNGQIWPRDHLLKPATTISPNVGAVPTTTSSISTSPSGCTYYPFDGSWAEANATGFSWSYSLGATSVNVPNVLKFNAHAPHYLPQVANQPLEVMPARVQVFMPASYFEALGYASLSEFNSSSYSVTTEDGQPTTPSVAVQEDGILINLGVQHYSAPNPSITITPKFTATTSTNSLPVSTVAPTTTSSTPKLLRTLARRKTAPLSSFLTTTIKGTKSWRVTGGCSITQSRLRAPMKKTTCTLTLTVRNAKKKVVATKTTKIRIS